MELLYLWIEDYKNIKQQGFNFSPLYDFEYDLNNKKLTLIDREVILQDNFFETEKEDGKKIGSNITNVTAIIGENGTGKSNIAKALTLSEGCFIVFKTNSKEDNIEVFQKRQYGIIPVEEFWRNQKNYKTYSTDYFENYISKSDLTKSFLVNENVFFIYYDNFFEEFPNQKFEEGYDNFFNESLSSRISRFNKKNNKFAYDEILNKIKIIDYLQHTKYELPFPFPDSLTVKVNTELIKKVNTDLGIDLFKNYRSIVGHKTDFLSNLQWTLFYSILGSGGILEIITNPESKKDQFSKLKDILESVSNNQEAYSGIDNLIDELELEALKDIKSHIKKIYEILEKSIDVNGKKIKNWLSEDIIELFNILSELDSLQVGRMFNFEWKKGSKDFYFSSGENALLRLFATLYRVKFYNKYDYCVSGIQNCVIWIDEGEIGMHPQWQKQYLTILLEVLPKLFENIKIQLILTSHSPFLASDLPKENIIFLKKAEGGRCEVADLLTQQRTFGQNIFELFADSFFVQDGLMGNFASKKIDAILDDLTKIKKGEKEPKPIEIKKLRKLIDVIGDDFLREKLEQYYGEVLAAWSDSPIAKRQRLLQELEDTEHKVRSIRIQLEQEGEEGQDD